MMNTATTLVTVDADFPGGNILVESIDGDTVTLRQDLRTTTEWWFYWCFRVRGVAGRTIKFVFTDGDVFTGLGPCYSPDGRNWQWLRQRVVGENAFSYTFSPGTDMAYFSMCIPYVEANLRDFVKTHPAVQVETLTQSEQGRAIEHLIVPSATGGKHILFTARHHACESMANYVLEGIIETWLADTPEGCYLREHVDLHAIPFMDKDGVEVGDQGKLRAPHDHNRDYTDAPLYASVRALMEQSVNWRGDLAVMIDLHCPWIRTGRNEEIFFVEPPEPGATEIRRLTAILESTQRGRLVFSAQNNLPCGVDWNSGESPTCTRYFREHSSARSTCTIEFPYALAGGRVATGVHARVFGRNLARALALYLQM